jgi:hypothetical protein
MATYRRAVFAIATTIAVAVVGIIYYRAFQPLAELATGQHSGPATTAVTTADVLVPTTLLIVLLGVWVWVLAGGVQRERARVRR